ncbi:MAG: phenylalanine--tRNA ligase subunit beta [Pseudomonadota bacterium]
MRLSYNWLKDYVDLSNTSPNELAQMLTMQVAEIEGIEEIGREFSDVTIAKVLNVSKHPDADKLSLALIEYAAGETKEVICGAANVAKNQVIAFVNIGGRLPDGTKIEKCKIRGVESTGMICSEKELGLAEESDGILILDEKTPLFGNFAKTLGMNDHVLIVDNKSITHRPDLWGHYGFAREIAAILNQKIPAYPEISENFDKIDAHERLSIEIEDGILCPRYSGLVVDNIKVQESPGWIQNRLRACDLRLINNIVDISNYVMLELGQPTHSFDYNNIKNGKIIVRRASEKEKFTTLDNIERTLTSCDLLICDDEKAVALAGVMGGANSEISDDTRSLLIESANFQSSNIRKTAGHIGLRTDSSNRFEKSLDPKMTTIAIRRIVELIKQQQPDIVITSPIVDAKKYKDKEIYIDLDTNKLCLRLGIEIPEENIIKTLNNLGFETQKLEGCNYKVLVPSYRATKDVSIFEDLVEEIGRIYQYDSIEPKAPSIKINPIKKNKALEAEKRARQILSYGLGFNEVYNYSFTNETKCELFQLNIKDHISLRHPITDYQTHLRRSLIPGLLDYVNINITEFDKIKLYEIGRGYFKELSADDEILPYESRTIAGLVANKVIDTTNISDDGSLFFETKNYIEELMTSYNLFDLQYSYTPKYPFLHPGRFASIKIKDELIGYLGQIHPQLTSKLDIKAIITVFELDINNFIDKIVNLKPFHDLPKFPATHFDISVVVPNKTLCVDIVKAINDINKDLIKNVELFDTYYGEQIGIENKSLTFKITIRSNKKTLEEKEISYLHNTIMAGIKNAGWNIR